MTGEGEILLTIFLKHQQEMSLAEINENSSIMSSGRIFRPKELKSSPIT